MNKLILFVLLVSPLLTFAQQTPDSVCPQISITGPSEILDVKKPIIFVATISDEIKNFNPTYVWTTSTGEIVDGQGTLTVSVRSNLSDSPTVTLEVKGLPKNCANTASESYAVIIIIFV